MPRHTLDFAHDQHPELQCPNCGHRASKAPVHAPDGTEVEPGDQFHFEGHDHDAGETVADALRRLVTTPPEELHLHCRACGHHAHARHFAGEAS